MNMNRYVEVYSGVPTVVCNSECRILRTYYVMVLYIFTYFIYFRQWCDIYPFCDNFRSLMSNCTGCLRYFLSDGI